MDKTKAVFIAIAAPSPQKGRFLHVQRVLEQPLLMPRVEYAFLPHHSPIDLCPFGGSNK